MNRQSTIPLTPAPVRALLTPAGGLRLPWRRLASPFSGKGALTLDHAARKVHSALPSRQAPRAAEALRLHAPGRVSGHLLPQPAGRRPGGPVRCIARSHGFPPRRAGTHSYVERGICPRYSKGGLGHSGVKPGARRRGKRHEAKGKSWRPPALSPFPLLLSPRPVGRSPRKQDLKPVRPNMNHQPGPARPPRRETAEDERSEEGIREQRAKA